MRYLLASLGILVATACFDTPAHAQNYPWCEYLGGGMGGGGGRNCGFISFEQCMESARGNGSDCRLNTAIRAAAGRTPAGSAGKAQIAKSLLRFVGKARSAAPLSWFRRCAWIETIRLCSRSLS